MTQRALVVGDVAVNVEPDQPTVDSKYHPEIAAQFVDVPDSVQQGWIKTGSTWGAPPTPASPAEASTTKIGPIVFMLRIPAAKRVGIRAFAAGTDPNAPLVADFLRILDDPRTLEVDVADPSVVSGVQGMVTLGLLTSGEASVALAPQPI